LVWWLFFCVFFGLITSSRAGGCVLGFDFGFVVVKPV
jgi:hypothetical protein